jgi:hypothetical protein
MGKPSPHGALGIDVGPPAPAPPLELPPLELPSPEPPLDVELLVPPLVVLGDAPMSLQYVGFWEPGTVRLMSPSGRGARRRKS